MLKVTFSNVKTSKCDSTMIETETNAKNWIRIYTKCIYVRLIFKIWFLLRLPRWLQLLISNKSLIIFIYIYIVCVWDHVVCFSNTKSNHRTNRIDLFQNICMTCCRLIPKYKAHMCVDTRTERWARY